MEIRVAVCERDAKQREYILASLKGLSVQVTSREYNNIYDLREAFEENDGVYDVVMLSTSVHQKGDGAELAKFIREKSLKTTIIMMSDCGDYYQQAFDAFAMAYLIKPVSLRDLERYFTFYTKNSKIERRSSWMVKSKGGNWTRLFCRDIEYIESDNREIIVHLMDGEEVHSYAKPSEVAGQLEADSFVRCHQSYIVNMFYVSEMSGTAFMIGDNVIPISRKFQKTVKEVYYHYMFGRM